MDSGSPRPLLGLPGSSQDGRLYGVGLSQVRVGSGDEWRTVQGPVHATEGGQVSIAPEFKKLIAAVKIAEAAFRADVDTSPTVELGDDFVKAWFAAHEPTLLTMRDRDDQDALYLVRYLPGGALQIGRVSPLGLNFEGVK